MEPTTFILLLLVFCFGVFFKWIWDVSKSRDAPCARCEDCEEICEELAREIEMMQNAKRGDSE